MKKTIFAVSDIHGEYQVLINSLRDAGFDENNPKHLLISLGDAFDRGSESLEVYHYLKRLSDSNKAIILKGNHTNFFTGYLDGSIISPFNYLHNGTNETMADFLHQTAPFESWCSITKNIQYPTLEDFANWLKEAREEILEEYPELLEWLNNRPYYYETEKYIFTHGAIDTLAEDWHYPHCIKGKYIDWEALMWDDGSFFGRHINNTDKTVVIGHFGTSRLRNMYGYQPIMKVIKEAPKGSLNGQDDIFYSDTGEIITKMIQPKDKDTDLLLQHSSFDDYGILYRTDNRVIAIDGTCNLTKKINVLVIEEETINE